MSERPKELASKASVGKLTEGSNPSATALVKGPTHRVGPFEFPYRRMPASYLVYGYGCGPGATVVVPGPQLTHAQVGGSGIGGTSRFPRREQGPQALAAVRGWSGGENPTVGARSEPLGFLPHPPGSRPSCSLAAAVREGKGPRSKGPWSLKAM